MLAVPAGGSRRTNVDCGIPGPPLQLAGAQYEEGSQAREFGMAVEAVSKPGVAENGPWMALVLRHSELTAVFDERWRPLSNRRPWFDCDDTL